MIGSTKKRLVLRVSQYSDDLVCAIPTIENFIKDKFKYE